jgi:hypothetical protein
VILLIYFGLLIAMGNHNQRKFLRKCELPNLGYKILPKSGKFQEKILSFAGNKYLSFAGFPIEFPTALAMGRLSKAGLTLTLY